MENIETIILEILEEVLGLEIDDETRHLDIIYDLCLDSLDIIEAFCVLEETLEIPISDEAIDTVKTIDELVRYLVTKKALMGYHG